jgi:uncharacterized protein (DUF885 family)
MTYLDEINDRFLDHLRADVDIGVGLGLPDHLHRLGDPSLEAHRRSVDDARALLDDIDESRTDDFYEALDLQLIRRYLQQDVFFKTLENHGELQRRRKPGGVDGVSQGIFQLFVNDERDSASRLADILSRLRQAPAYLKAEVEVLTTPVRRWRDVEVQQAAGIPELLDSILAWARETDFPDTAALERETGTVREALEAYREHLAALPTTDTFSIGIDKVEELLALKQIDRTPEALRRMAADYMSETQATLEELRRRLVEKYGLDADTDTAALHEFLNSRFAVGLRDGELASVLDHYQRERETVLRFNDQRKLFPIPDDQDMVIRLTPGFLQPVIPAGAMWPPLALREGTAKSMVYLTVKEDQLDEHTRLGICMMMIHEGIPGHHLQFASAVRQDSLVRRMFDANEHAEGWTTMLEDYMLDAGFVDSDIEDEVRFVTKRDISRLVARVGIDLYFMTGDSHYLNVGLDLEFDSDDPFENAARLLKTATGFTDGRVQAELNWYSTEQGYPLSYLTGNRMVWELKSDLQEANRKSLSGDELDREFHRIYLQSGCMPVASLREVFRHEGFL